MRRTQAVLFTAGLWLGSLGVVTAAQAEDGQDAGAQQQETAQPEAGQPQPEASQPQPEASQPQPEVSQPEGQAVQPQQEQTQPQSATPATPPNYELKSVTLDEGERHIGDTVPEKYLTKPYEIVEWQKRHLPPPEENSHWTYISGNYLLVTNDTGKILKADSGDIFFSN